MGAVASLPVYMIVGGGEGVEVGKLEIEADANGQFTVTADGIADMLRTAADAYDALAATGEDVTEGVPDAAAQQ